MRKKFLSIVLCVCMMLTMVPFAFAAEGDSTSEPISTNEDLVQAIANAKNGDTITLGTGTFNTVGNTKYPKSLTFVGAGKDTVWTIGDLSKNVNGEANGDYTFDGADSITFKNMTLKSDNYNYRGFIRIGTTNVENCTLEGRTAYWGYTAATFTNCIFNAPDGDYALWDYSSPTMTFNGCTFNVSGKTVNVSVDATSDTAHKVVMTDCTVNSTKANKAVLNIKNANQAWDIEISNTKVTGLDADATTGSNLYQVEKTGSEGKALTVSVDGKTVWKNGAPAIDVAEVNGEKYTSLAEAVEAANDGDTITLCHDIDFGAGRLTIRKAITLDLAGYKITSSSDICTLYFTNAATVTDSVGNGKIENTYGTRNGIGVVSGGESADLTLNGIAVSGYYGVYIQLGANVTVINSNIKADICGIAVIGQSDSTKKNSSVTVKSGTVEGGDYAISGNGTNQGTEITITGGTIRETGSNGGGAIYHPQNGTLSISGDALIEGENGIQLCSGEGVIANITGGTIRATGTDQRASKTGDGFISDGAALSIVNRNYPGGTPKMNVSGGNFTSVNSDAVLAYTWSNNQASQWDTAKEYFTISGGYFTSDPSAYCVEGKTGIPSDKSGYAFMVGDSKDTTVVPATGKTTVDETKMGNLTETAQNAAKSAASNVTDTSGVLAAAAKQEAGNVSTADADKAKEDLEKAVSVSPDETVKVYVQTYLAVTPTNAETNSSDTSKIESITLDIQPMSRVVASTAAKAEEIQLKEEGKAQNAVILAGSEKPINIQTMTISIALPSAFNIGSNNTVYVQHKGYEYTATVENNVATFTNPHGFSEFTISTTSQTVAKIGDTNYTSLQDAVNAAIDGDTITVTKGDNLSASMSGSSKTIKVKNGTTTEIKVTINGTEKTLAVKDSDGDTAEFTYTRPSHSSSGSTTTYAVNVNAATNGTVAADKKTAAKGDTVTVTVTPSTGYVVDAVKVVDKDGKDVAVTEKNGKYVFTMPASAVTVTASFKAETPAPSGLPFVDVKSGDWFYDAVKYAYENGLMNGTSETTFAPNGTMNRAMIVTVLYRLEKTPAVTAPAKFADVPAGQWYSDAVAWAAANNIVNGYDETTFGPLNAVTREQMAAILYRYEQYKGMDTVTLEENLNRFPDKDKISAYAVPALQWAVGQKVINGNADGTLDPTGTATRAQVAQIFMNLLNQ